MSKSKKTAKARELQALTGMPYTAALRQVEAEHAERQTWWDADLINELVSDPDVTDVHVFHSGMVMVRLHGGGWKKAAQVSASTVETAAHVSRAVRTFAAARNINIPASGGTTNVTFADATAGTVRMFVNVDEQGNVEAVLRKHPETGLKDLLESGTVTKAEAELLMNAANAGNTICVTGSVGTGKSTLVRSLAPFQPDGGVTISEVRDESSLKHVVDASRGDGSLFTVFGQDPEGGLRHLVLYAQLAELTETLVVDAVDLVVHMEKCPSEEGVSYVRRVTMIGEPYMDGGSASVRPVDVFV